MPPIKSPARDAAEFAIWRLPMKQLQSYDHSAANWPVTSATQAAFTLYDFVQCPTRRWL